MVDNSEGTLEQSSFRLATLFGSSYGESDPIKIQKLIRSKYGLGDRRTLDQAIAFSGIDTRHIKMDENKCGNNLEYVPFIEHIRGPDYIPLFDTHEDPIDIPDTGSIYYDPNMPVIPGAWKKLEGGNDVNVMMRELQKEEYLEREHPPEVLEREHPPDIRTDMLLPLALSPPRDMSEQKLQQDVEEEKNNVITHSNHESSSDLLRIRGGIPTPPLLPDELPLPLALDAPSPRDGSTTRDILLDMPRDIHLSNYPNLISYLIALYIPNSTYKTYIILCILSSILLLVIYMKNRMVRIGKPFQPRETSETGDTMDGMKIV